MWPLKFTSHLISCIDEEQSLATAMQHVDVADENCI